MKKFSKILTVLLTLAAIVTAFTVVTLATTEEPALSPIVKYDNNFDSYDYGTYLGDNSTKSGYFGAHGQEGSTDKYLLHYGKEHTTTKASSFLAGLYSYGTASKDAYGNNVAVTNISDYPYAVFEFDIMKITNSYSTFSVGTYIKNSAGGLKPASSSVKSSSLTNYLPSEQYEWAKVTVIFAYHSETVDGAKTGYLSTYAYVNGTQAYKYYKAVTFSYDSDGEYGATVVDGEKTVHGALESGLYFTDLRLDTSSWTNTDTTTRSAFDNVKLTVYPAGHTLDELVGMTYSEGYTFPYTKTRAILNGKGYESVKAAIDVANDGDTVYLREDVEEPIVINKAINIVADATKLSAENPDGVDYDATGIIQDETKEAFTFNYVSYTGYVAEQNGSTYSFALADKLAKVDWDYCDGECDCYFKDAAGHILTAETLVPLGNVPDIPVAAPTFEIENGLKVIFKGWSYTKGATEADTLVAITEDDVANGVKIYPVYEITQYSFEIVPTEGTSSYYLDSEWATAFEKAPAKSTIKLHTDVTIDNPINFSGAAYSKSINIDLNGYAFNKMIKVVTQYSATLGNNGEYVKGAALGDAVTTGAGSYMFNMSSYSGHVFTMSSSRPGATVTHLKVTAEEWVDGEGNVVKTVVNSITSGGGLVSLYPAGSTFNILGENIEFRVGKLFYGEHGGNNSNLKINIDGGTFYQLSNDYLFQIYYGGTHSVKNATFYCNSGSITLQKYDKSTSFTFENCDIISSSGPYVSGATESNTFINCRMQFNGITTGSGKIYFGDDCISVTNHANATLADGLETVPSTYVKTYVFHAPVVAPDLKTVTSAEVTKTVTYAYEIANSATDFATVTWNDPDGNFISTSEKVLKSAYAEATQPTVKFPVGDGLRGYTNPTWLNADGSVANLVLGKVDGNTFTFKASMPAEPNYVAHITDAMFNLAYYGHFGYNLYIPKVEGVTYIQIGDYANPNYMYDAKIDGVDYIYANAGWIGPANAIKEYTKYVKYEIDGVQYSAAFKLNAMLYAELLLSDTVNTAEVEKDAILKMMDYVEEAYKISAENGTLDEETQAKFDNFFTKYNGGARPDRVTEYPQSEIHTVDPDFAKHVSELGFAIYKNNARYSLIAKLNADAVAAGYTLKISGMTTAIYTNQDSNKNNIYNDDGSLTYYTNNTGLAGGIMYGNIILSVYDPESKTTVASTSYSLATYIDGVKKQGGDTDLAEALYSFGKAVIKVRAYLSTK